MSDYINLCGTVGSDFRMHTSPNGKVWGTFRMAVNQRKQDPGTGNWVDANTNWYGVTVFDKLATNSMVSLHKGDSIIVVGKFSIDNFVRQDGSAGIDARITAEHIGPDLRNGVANYTRNKPKQDQGSVNNNGNGGSFGENASAPAPVPSNVSGNGFEDPYGEQDDLADDEADDAPAAAGADDSSTSDVVDPDEVDMDELERMTDPKTGEMKAEAPPF